ncbi:hypothetical protein [Pseudorhodoplanes sinuspersici]|uniref:hypothetical protein n=1 Tax=Pseudorhodoplanes sinuspersici TaxID=1235591 RepID=UPI0011C366D9|nr:hypothetical protein [Pseudorhodoplanes sinuspersici]
MIKKNSTLLLQRSDQVLANRSFCARGRYDHGRPKILGDEDAAGEAEKRGRKQFECYFPEQWGFEHGLLATAEAMTSSKSIASGLKVGGIFASACRDL